MDNDQNRNHSVRRQRLNDNRDFYLQGREQLNDNRNFYRERHEQLNENRDSYLENDRERREPGTNVFVNPPRGPPSPPRVFHVVPPSPSPPRNPRRPDRRRPSTDHNQSRGPFVINIGDPIQQVLDVTILAEHYLESGGGIGDLEYLRRHFGRGRERKKIAKLGKHRKPEHGPAILSFFCWKKGRLVDDDRVITFTPDKHKRDGDIWLIDKMKNSYRTKLDRSLIFPLRTIGFAKYVRMQKIEKKWRVTAQQTVERYKDSSSVSRFIYRLRYPFVSKTIRPWMKTLETLIEQVEGECVILIELFEVPNTATIYGLLYLVIILCTGAGIAYAVISKDIATGISLGGYMVACLALILALVSAGEFIGLQRPDSYSWAYDVVDCEEAWEISNLEEEAWKAYNKYLIDQP